MWASTIEASLDSDPNTFLRFADVMFDIFGYIRLLAGLSAYKSPWQTPSLHSQKSSRLHIDLSATLIAGQLRMTKFMQDRAPPHTTQDNSTTATLPLTVGNSHKWFPYCSDLNQTPDIEKHQLGIPNKITSSW